jgi:hypothetical protein
MKNWDRLKKLLSDAKYVKSEYDKRYLSQLFDIVRLRNSFGKIGTTEYFFYGLYDDNHYTYADKAQFLGWRMQDPIDRCVPKEWWNVVEDKLVLYGYLTGLGYPTPNLYAIYHPFRTHGSIRAIRNRDDLIDFLTTTNFYPLFAKPNHAGCARGAYAITEYDSERFSLCCSNGDEIMVDDFFKQIEEYRDEGYIFQELIRTHSWLAPLVGDRVTTVRLVVLITEQGPQIIRAAWRIPTGRNMADNFSLPGNMMGGIDLTRGNVTRVVQGIGTEQKEIREHPDSGISMLNIVLPEWERTKELCIAAAASLPGIMVQGWDVALGDGGPIILEANIVGDFDLPQMANGEGLLSTELRGALKSVGLM